MKTAQFSFPTSIYFGPGVRSLIPDFLKSHEIYRPLLVTDLGISKEPFFAELKTSLFSAGFQIEVFSNFSGNPLESHVRQGVEAYQSHLADSIVAIGGGAAIDIAKAIALMSNHPGHLFDYEDGKPSALSVQRTIPFWIAIPTTAGTGSEVGRSTVISDDQTRVKKVIFSPKLLAKAVFADPELTLQLPSPITAATGMDALTHCLEAYLAKGYHPICDGIALEGVRLISESLSQAYHSPDSIEARASMLMGSMMGAIAFQKGLGMTHSCAHALSTVLDLHHGYANGLMVNHTLRFNLTSAPERFQDLAQAIQLKNQDGMAVIDWLTQLKDQLQIPQHLSEAAVQQSQLETLADLAFQDSCHLNNPRDCTRDDFLRVFQEAF